MKKVINFTLAGLIVVVLIFVAVGAWQSRALAEGGKGNPGGPGNPTETGSSNGDLHGKPGNPGNNNASAQGCLHGEPDCNAKPPATNPPPTNPPPTNPPGNPSVPGNAVATITCPCNNGWMEIIPTANQMYTVTFTDENGTHVYNIEIYTGDAKSNGMAVTGNQGCSVKVDLANAVNGQLYTIMVSGEGHIWIWEKSAKLTAP